MGYFPAFIKFDTKKIVVIGGGNIATQKISHLLDFTNDITIIANFISPTLKQISKQHNLNYQLKSYKQGDIKGYDIVIVAVDDIDLQKNIYDESKQYNNCLVNSVDNTKYCDFIFPSYIKTENLTIAISTNGSSPAFTRQLKLYLKQLIPKDIDQFLEEMKTKRKTIPKGENRMDYFKQKAKDYIQNWGKTDEI